MGFWPTSIALLLSLAAVGLLQLEGSKVGHWVSNFSPGLILKDGDTARTILATTVGGLISLTVFSFSMVMSLLNRAASTLSPRLLPGLISDKRHQSVLGIFLGSIAYCLIVLASIDPSDDGYELPGMAIFGSIALVFVCLAVFVYFLHSISSAVQVSKVLAGLAKSTYKAVSQKVDDIGDSGPPEPDKEGIRTIRENGFPIVASEAGWRGPIYRESLLALTKEHDVQALVAATPGAFVLGGSPLLWLSSSVPEEVVEEFRSCVGRERGDTAQELEQGCRQIIEIAVRALSPGVNDPSTAIRAVQQLAEILQLRARLPDMEVILCSEGTPRIHIPATPYHDLLFELFSPLRCYGAGDSVFVLSCIDALQQVIAVSDLPEEREKQLAMEIERLAEDALEDLTSESDRERIKTAHQEFSEKAPFPTSS